MKRKVKLFSVKFENVYLENRMCVAMMLNKEQHSLCVYNMCGA